MEEDTQHNKVFIIGAGTSADFHPKGPEGLVSTVPFPIGDNFFKIAIEHGVLKDRNYFGQQMYKPLLGYIQEQYDLSYGDLKKGARLNVEQVYIDLEKQLSDKGKMDDRSFIGLYIAQRPILLRRIIEELFNKLCRHNEPCRYHEILARYIVDTDSTVISFNWDILLDEALYNTGQWFYESGYGFKFKRLYRDKREFKETEKKSKGLLIKPHGSINWFRYRHYVRQKGDGFTGETVTDEERDDIYLCEFSRYSPGITDIQPIDQRLNMAKNYAPQLKIPGEIHIIPPGVRENRDPFKDIWDEVKKTISEADEIIAIGFALKDETEEDKYEKEIFSEARDKSNRKLLLRIVNKAKESDANTIELLNRYKIAFRPEKIEFPFSSFKDYCVSLVSGWHSSAHHYYQYR